MTDTHELLVNGKPIQYDRVPVDYMADGLRLYFEHGIEPGDFMLCVLANDLMGACGHADLNNQRALWNWAAWLYNYAPVGSYGSRERVYAWIEARRTLHVSQP